MLRIFKSKTYCVVRFVIAWNFSSIQEEREKKQRLKVGFAATRNNSDFRCDVTPATLYFRYDAKIIFCNNWFQSFILWGFVINCDKVTEHKHFINFHGKRSWQHLVLNSFKETPDYTYTEFFMNSVDPERFKISCFYLHGTISKFWLLLQFILLLNCSLEIDRKESRDT